MNTIEEKLKNKYLTKPDNSDGPSFILSDGSFCLISFNQKGDWIEKYNDGSIYYSEHLDRLKSDNFTDEEIKWIFNNLPQTNNCRPEEETIVRLPSKNKPNDNQLNSIRIFIDENIMNEGYIKVGVENSNIWQDYILWDNGNHSELSEENEHIDSDYIISRIMNYYKSGRLTENLNINKILEVVKDNLITTFEVPKGPTYILPKGEFIDLYNSITEENAHEDFICHAEVEDILKDNNIKTIKDPYNDGSPTIESIGAIRCNDAEEENNYVLLPEKRPTEPQFKSLLKWLDKNSYRFSQVVVGSNNFDNVVIYKYTNYIPDEIIKKIKKYYAVHKLEEDINTTKPLAPAEDILNFIYSDVNLSIEDNPSMFAGCILPNGKFLNIKYSNLRNPIGVEDAYKPTFDSYCDSATHEAFEYYLNFRSKFDSKIPYYSVASRDYLYSYIDSIKVNGVEGYIEIYSKFNNAQAESLEDWLWKYAETHSSIEISFDLQNSFKLFRYEIKNSNPEPLIKMLYSFQRTGKIQTSIRESKNKLNEQLLLELNRSQLINKSKKSDYYKDTSKGRNRWERRNRSKIDTHVAQYNKIDMNKLFKDDELICGIDVHGETDNYTVTIRYLGVIRELANQIKFNNNKLEFKCVLVSLQRIFNLGNVFVSCTCPDWKYRQAYNASRGGYNSGPLETRASDITNKNDSKGAGCKHVNLVIGNVDWIMKVASVINNYIHYMKDHMERKYADIIFPKLFNMPYQKAVQLNLFDTDDELDSSEDEIKLSNRYGRDRTKFRSDVRINNQGGKHKELIPEEENNENK